MNQLRGNPGFIPRRIRHQTLAPMQPCRAGETVLRMRFACGAVRQRSMAPNRIGSC